MGRGVCIRGKRLIILLKPRHLSPLFLSSEKSHHVSPQKIWIGEKHQHQESFIMAADLEKTQTEATSSSVIFNRKHHLNAYSLTVIGFITLSSVAYGYAGSVIATTLTQPSFTAAMKLDIAQRRGFDRGHECIILCRRHLRGFLSWMDEQYLWTQVICCPRESFPVDLRGRFDG